MDGPPLDRISQLEHELEAIKGQAKAVYQERRTESPVRERIINSLSSVETQKNQPIQDTSAVQSVKPTYIEESTLAVAKRPGSAALQGKRNSLKIMMKIGIGFMVVSLLIAFFNLIFRLI